MLDQKIQEITDKIVREFKPEKVVLFGSYAWGVPTKDSDVDLFIVKDDPIKNTHEMGVELEKILLNRPIALDLLVYKPDQVVRRLSMGDPFVAKVWKQGRILYER